MNNMNKAPIFIVGVPRSGTTLLAAMLAAHRNLSCGPETHFFRRLSEADPDQIINPKTWPKPALEFICSINHTNFLGPGKTSLIDKYQIDKKDIEYYLESIEPSICNTLSSVTEQYMLRMGKRRWIEKTPDHIQYLILIRTYFPDSPIIAIIRDPRDVALSLTKVPWSAKTFLEALMYWKRLDQDSQEFFSNDGICYTLRFEDLISAPQAVLQKLCQFIGEEYDKEMQNTSLTGAQINTRSVPWKDKARQSIDKSRIYRWRNILTEQERLQAEALVGDRLGAYNYSREEINLQLGEVIPNDYFAVRHAENLGKIALCGIRFWKYRQDEQPSVKVYIGDPGDTNWLKENKLERLVNTVLISLDIIKSNLTNKRIYWIQDEDKGIWTGYCGYVLKRLLSPYLVTSEIIRVAE